MSRALTGWIAAVTLALGAWAPVRAAEGDALSAPVIVINVASVNHWIENTNFVFQTINRDEIGKAAEGQLSRVGDLKGLDRTKPFGVMLFLDGFSLRSVGYLPVTNADDLAKALSIGPVTIRKVDGKDGRYELTGGRQTLYAKVQGEHAYVTDRVDLIERELPDPTEATKTLSTRYDLAVSANLDRIPEVTRQTFLALLKNAGEAQLQQRDNEPRGAYLIRRASGMNNMQLLTELLEHGKSLTLGWDVAPENKRAAMEFDLTVRPDSEFAQYLQKVASKQSHFRGLLNDRAPLGFGISWAFDEKRKKMFLEVLKAAREGNTPKEEEKETASTPAIAKIIDQLTTTAETGHLDAFVQMAQTEKGKFVIGGGLRVADADGMSGALSDLVASLKESPNLKEVTPDATLHRGVALHRLVPKQVGGREQAVYGEDSSILVGAGSQAVWFSFGGEEAGMALKRMIDGVSDTDRIVRQDSTAPFKMVINVERWMALSGREEAAAAPPEGRRGGGNRVFRDVAKEALVEGKDAVRIDFRPTENGGRLRLEFDEGFLRMIGLGIARQFDRSQL